MAGVDDIGPILASLTNGVSAKEHDTLCHWAQDCDDPKRAQALRELAKFVGINKCNKAREKNSTYLQKSFL